MESFEKSLEKLETIVSSLESGDLTLDESIKAFEEGMKLAGRCEAKLEEAQQKVELLIKPCDGPVVMEAFGGKNESE